MLKSFCEFFFLGLAFIVASFSLAAFEQPVNNQSFKSSLTIAINETSFPYHYVDAQGRAAGLMPDLWRLWAKRQQVTVKFVTLSWLETIKQVKEGEVDIHAGLFIIDSRKSYLGFSRPLFPLHTHIYVHADLLQVNKIEDLSPYAIGVVNGSAHIDMLNKSSVQFEHKIFSKRNDLYEAAINKEVLAFTGLERLANNYQYYQQLIAMYPAHKRLRIQQGGYGVAVAKNNEALLEFIELGMEKISRTEKSNIERKWLGMDKNKDSLSIAFPPDYPPYSALSLTGQPQGFIIDMWRLWAKQTNTKITFVARSIEESLTLIESGDIDILLGFPKSWLDKNHFSLAKPIYQSKAKMFISKRLPNVVSLNYFEQSQNSGKVGIWEKTPFKPQLQTQYPDLSLQTFPTFDGLLKAAELGEIDAFIAHVDFTELKLIKENVQSFFYTLDLPMFSLVTSPLVKKGNSRLANIIDDGFKQIKLEQLASLEERWLIGDDHYYKNLLEKITLTKQEQQFLEQNATFDVGFLKSYEPIEFINSKGEFSGINRDILDLITKRTGLNFNFISYDSWHQLYQSMLEDEIDIIMSIKPTAARQESLLFTHDYRQVPWTILHPNFIGRQSKLSSFYGKKLAIVKGYHLVDYFREKHPLITIEIVKNREEGLLALQQGKVNGLIESITSASQLIKQESLVSLMISVIEEIPLDKSHLGVSKQNPYLQAILNKGLSSISREEKNKIHDKWFSVDVSTGLDEDVVLRVAIQASVLTIVVLCIIIIWNRRLKMEIKRRKQLEKSMKHMATHDDLTGLANRVLLKDRLITAIEFHQRQSLMLAVIFLDLDSFKIVNDSYGHNVGDELLLIVAKRLQSCVRKSDTVVRFGGDEFVLLLTGLHAANEAAYVAEKILELMQLPFKLSADTVKIGCSIGIALYPEDGINEADLLKEADSLMYQVKSAGKNHYLFNKKY